MLNSNDENYICFLGAIHKADQTIWISMMEFNALVKIDIETGLVQLVDCFQKEYREGHLHLQMVSYQNKVIFIPWNAENIAIYDIRKNEMRYISISSNGDPGLFGDGIQDGKYLYLMSETASEIIQFDMESEKIVNDYFLESADAYEPFAIYLYVKPIKINNKIWKISGHRNMSWSFDLCNKQFMVHKYLLEEELNFIAGSAGRDCVWLIADNDLIYQLSTDFVLRRKFDIHRIMKEVFHNAKRDSFDCICLSNSLVIVFYDKKSVVKIPIIDNCLYIEKYQYRQYRRACFSIENDKLVIILPDRAFLIEEDGQEIIFNIPQQFSIDLMREKHGFLVECDTRIIDLGNFVDYVCNGKTDPVRNTNRIISVGKNIFNMTKGE